MDFPELISRAAVKMGDVFLPGLHGIEEFESIRNNPQMYEQDALEYLSDKESKHKFIAVLSMQKLPYEELLLFYRKVYQLFSIG